jgi:hypothetical protein
MGQNWLDIEIGVVAGLQLIKIKKEFEKISKLVIIGRPTIDDALVI